MKRDGWLSGRARRSHRRGHRFNPCTVHMSNIIAQYLEWHFIEQTKAVLQAWHNYLYFNLNYFSVPLLVKTFFSPWRRYSYSYGRGFDLKRYIDAWTFNAFSRVMGMILRTFLIVFALIIEFFVFLAGLLLFFFWLFLPIILIIMIIHGLQILL